MTVAMETYREAILYFLQACDNDYLGKTKLMKLLYYLDFDHYEQFNLSVTGDVYRKLPYGPVPSEAATVLDWLEWDGAIEHVRLSRGERLQDRYTPLREADLSIFAATERAVLERVAEAKATLSLATISEATHREAPWRLTNGIGSIIPYDYAHLRRSDLHRNWLEQSEDPLSVAERELLVVSLIGTQAIEGIVVPSAMAERVVDQAFALPLPQIG